LRRNFLIGSFNWRANLRFDIFPTIAQDKASMTYETPGKVITLLTMAMVSMFALFVVTVTNASFSGAETPFPDPFAPQKVVALLDNVSHNYSQFLAENLFAPTKADFALYHDNASWVIDESADSVLAITGLSDLASVQYYQNLDQARYTPRVAGAYTDREYQSGGLSINSLYSILIR
jgi:hypothetical protein